MSAVPLSAVDKERRDQALRLVQCFDASGLQMDPNDWAAKLRLDLERARMEREDFRRGNGPATHAIVKIRDVLREIDYVPRGLLGHVDPALEDSKDLLTACGIVQRGFGLLLSCLLLSWLLLSVLGSCSGFL